MRSVFIHGAQALTEGALIALLIVGLVAGTTLAAKGGGGGHGKPSPVTGGGTLALVLLDSTDGAAHWGHSVTYTVTTTSTASPYVSTTCTQGGILVLSTSAGFFASYPWPTAQVVVLKTDRWTGGAADCSAKLYSMDGGRQTTLATIQYHVDG